MAGKSIKKQSVPNYGQMITKLALGGAGSVAPKIVRSKLLATYVTNPTVRVLITTGIGAAGAIMGTSIGLPEMVLPLFEGMAYEGIGAMGAEVMGISGISEQANEMELPGDNIDYEEEFISSTIDGPEDEMNIAGTQDMNIAGNGDFA